MNEAETRAELIDPALKSAGWGVVEGSHIRREYKITLGRLVGSGKREKAEIADYVLVYKNTKLAVIEAKKRDAPYTEGVAQAKAYAAKLDVRFIYATNGKKLYGVDRLTGKEGDVATYPTPGELWARTFPTENPWRDKFAAVPFEDKGGMWSARYYQDIAIRKALEAIAGGQERILLTLATGTGKTAIAFQIAWTLYQSRWNRAKTGERRPRVLFLADRNILANQAYNAFSTFEDAIPGSLLRIRPDAIAKKGGVPKNGSIFFTIFQTFMSGPKDTPNFGEYPPDFFDFIIIDECHRGGASDESSWRAILEYFAPAVQLGLTATPKRDDNVDTYDYFGEPVYKYSLKDGINDGYLTPYRVRRIGSDLDTYKFEDGDAVTEGVIDAEKTYEEGDFNRIIVVPKREKHRVEQFMALLDQKQKTLVFCANQAHALMVRDFISQTKSSADPDYCVRVTANDGERGEQFLRDFQDNEKTIPTILTTSQKLSTGVDARNVRNIVLLRPVNSMIEFKQILGRGARLFDGKDYFALYDFVDAQRHFADPEWDGDPLPPETEDDKPVGEKPPAPTGVKDPMGDDYEPKPNITVELSPERTLSLTATVETTFYSPTGNPITVEEFLKQLYGTLPELARTEEELRDLWSVPETRKSFLYDLASRGFPTDKLGEIQSLIDAEKSDLFDVLVFLAYSRPTLTRARRAAHARHEIQMRYAAPQQAFLDFVLDQYIEEGAEELFLDKLSPLLSLKYGTLGDATETLGSIKDIRALFNGFQRYLYEWNSDETEEKFSESET